MKLGLIKQYGWAWMILGSLGCGSSPNAVVPIAETSMIATDPSTNLPPPPVPATFDVAALAERVKPTVVNITTRSTVKVQGPDMNDPFFDFFFGGRRPSPDRVQKRNALGTGFIIDPSGYVVTNEHVVHAADDVRVKLADEREFAADVVGRDPKLDLAILKLRNAKDLPATTLGSSEQLRVGEHVLAVGNPFGLGHTVTLGIVSAKARSIGAGPYDDFVQTDASINPGNSGGPLFNWKGEVVGINTAIKAGANGIGFAIPVDALKNVLPQLRDKGHVERGKLGVLIQPITPEIASAMGMDSVKGALISDVEPGGSAAKAGIKSGDVIVAVNGTPIVHSEDLPKHVARNAPGSKITVTVRSGKQTKDVVATLDLLKEEDVSTPNMMSHAPNVPKLGMQLSDAPSGGVRIDGIRRDSTVEDLEPGDVIVELNGKPVKNVKDFQTIIESAKPGSNALAKVQRDKMSRFVAIPVPEKK